MVMGTISFKMIFRSWWRNKTFALISILSLGVGIACINLLAAFVIHEYNIEGDNPNKDRIAVLKLFIPGDGMSTVDYTRPDMTDQLLDHVSELEKACRVIYCGNASYCKVGENLFTDFRVIESDSSFLQFFPQKQLQGSLEDALVGPDRIILAESFAKRLFGRSEAIGQTVQIQFGPTFFTFGDKEGLSVPFTVSAVVKDNEQAAFAFDALFLDKPTTGTNFFLLKNNTTIPDLQAKVAALKYRDMVTYELLSIQEACFSSFSTPSYLKKPNMDLLWIALFSAILILAIACFNYINLSFSRVFKQLYSIHVQKLMGAGTRQLSMQLFADTCMTVGLGFLIAQLIQLDLLSVMNRIMSVQMPASFLYSHQMLPVTFGFILLLACIPALYMSRQLPKLSISIYNNFYRGKAKRRIITSLAVVQFAISFILIIGTFSVRQQLSLLYDKVENYKDVYTFSVGDLETGMLPLKERIAHIPGIQAVSVGSPIYGDVWLSGPVEGVYEHFTLEEGDEELMDVMKQTLLQGVTMKEALKLYAQPVYLNRTWVQSLFPNGDSPVGQLLKKCVPKMTTEIPPVGDDQVIAGVVEDYFDPQKVNSLETPIEKSIIAYTREGTVLKVRIDPPHTSGVIRQIYNEWDKLYPEKHLEHESVYAKAMDKNKKLFELSDLLLMYSIISILLTCFGLFGMSLYAIEQRTKEIGIRKVNGSSTLQIMQLLNRQFISWIGIAFGIAVPVIWWMIRRWMESFTYRADFSIWIYILSLLTVVAITLLTVSWHSYRAASGNPVKALRSE